MPKLYLNTKLKESNLMTNQSLIINNTVNQAFFQSQLQRSKNFSSPLCVVKFELKFDPKETQKYQEIFSFIYSYLNFTPVVYESGNSYLLFIHENKIHTVVSTLKNMFMSIKIKYQIHIKNIGVTDFEEDETIDSLLSRVHTFLMKSKLSKSVDIYYGTSYFEYSHNGSFQNLQHIFEQSPDLNAYGFYKEMPLLNKVKILEANNDCFVIHSQKEYLPFMRKQEYVYLEHEMIPDILRADILHIDYQKSTIEMGNIKFLDNSPVHRKNVRITPHRPLQATLEYEDELFIEGLIADISKNSILFTTQINKIEEIQIKGLHAKTFTASFSLSGIDRHAEKIEMKAMIYKVFGNQIVLNIYPSLQVQNIIMEYITMCQNLLLLEVKGGDF